MAERIVAGTWVELHRIVLAPGARAPQVPDDTRRVPLELRCRGLLLHDATIGEPAEVVSLAGRRLTGTLMEANPGYTHGFGRPVPPLGAAGRSLRAEVWAARPEPAPGAPA
jgi:hypothetical protein